MQNITHEQIEKLSEDLHTIGTLHKDMVDKVRTHVYINKRLKKLAEEFGLNLSSFLEIKLFEHFKELLLLNTTCGGRDLNPRTPTGRDPESGFAVLEYSKHRAEFIQWVSEGRSISTWQPYVRYLDEMLSGRVITSPRELAEFIDEYERRNGRKMSKNRKNAIKVYLKFLVKKGYARQSQVVDYYPLLETGKSGIRKTPIPTDEQIIKAHEYLLELVEKKESLKYDPEANLLAFYLQVFGGVRLTEACDILNNFDERELTIKDNFARYDLLELYKRIRSTKAKAEASKRAWVCYMPVWVAKKLKRIEVSYGSLKGDRYCNGIVTGIGVREWFSSFLARNKVEERIIEFMTGKTPSTILRKHYLDLLREADEWYSRIVDKFPI